MCCGVGRDPGGSSDALRPLVMVSAETGGREGKRERHADWLPSATSCLCRPSSVTGLAVTHTGVRPASSRAALCGAQRCSRWPAAGRWRAWGPAWPPSTRLHAHSPRAAPVLPLPGLLRHSAPPRSARTCGADVLPCRGPTCVSGPCRFPGSRQPRSAGASCFRPSPPSSVRSPRGASPLTKAAALPCCPQGSPRGGVCAAPRFRLAPAGTAGRPRRDRFLLSPPEREARWSDPTGLRRAALWGRHAVCPDPASPRPRPAAQT